MKKLAEIRNILRPKGDICPQCGKCVYFSVCGGMESGQPLLNCFDLCRSECGSCDNVCPEKPDFGQRMEEINGLRFDDLSKIGQNPRYLPSYVPMIHHRYSRSVPLRVPVVALETYELFRFRNGEYRLIASSAEELRKYFVLDQSTRIILRGTARDKPLENYWAYRRRDNAAGQLSQLGIDLVIGPNFSHFLGVPRTDNLFNRKRQLICLEELADAGLSAVPHLSAVMPADWRFWANYLRSNEGIRYVAVEFQTGNRTGMEGKKVIDNMVELRERIGRGIHPIIIGGFQYVKYIAGRFRDFTLLDSQPFMTAVKRRRLVFDKRGPKWVSDKTLPGFGIDDHLANNIERYASWVSDRISGGRSTAKRAG